jgi:hypothetical protein
VQPLLGHPVSENYGELVSNIEEQPRSRILGGIEKGSEGQTQLQYFNLAMENVLKGLPDKISCPYIIHKCTSNVHIFLITFKLRDRMKL